jgi:CheY-like chemotaxis protein
MSGCEMARRLAGNAVLLPGQPCVARRQAGTSAAEAAPYCCGLQRFFCSTDDTFAHIRGGRFDGFRKIVWDTLAEDPALAIVGSASDGRAALAKLPLVNPEWVTLDFEMPGISGPETLVAIRKAYPKLPVIMYSTLTDRDASATLEALSLGASDYTQRRERRARGETGGEKHGQVDVMCEK